MQVLTVNQVVDILLAWADKRDWGAAFQSVIPGRKQVVAKEGDAKDGSASADQPAVKLATKGAAADGSSADVASGREANAAVDVEGTTDHADGDRKRVIVSSSGDSVAAVGKSKRQKKEPSADVLS